MNCPNSQEMGLSENHIVGPCVTSAVSTVGSSVAPFVSEKRTIPLLYVQSPLGKGNGTMSPEIQSPTQTPANSSPVNGVSGKLVQVHSGSSQNSTVAYLGTLFKPGTIGKERIAQKVLLTPVKGTDGMVKRFILPKTSVSGGGVSVMVPRSYVIQPRAPSAVTMGVNLQSQQTPATTPNIIRQRTTENKVLVTQPSRSVLAPQPPEPPAPLDIVTIDDDGDVEQQVPPKRIEEGEDTGSVNKEEPTVELQQVQQAQVGSRRRKAAPLPAKQDPGPRALPGAEDYDPLHVIEWDAYGMGSLPGSDIKFVLNEFGLIEVVEESNTRSQDSFQDRGRVGRESEDIYCCEGCGCYGLISEFYSKRVCSRACHELLDAKARKTADSPDSGEGPKKKRILDGGVYSDDSDRDIGPLDIGDERDLDSGEGKRKSDSEYADGIIKVRKVIKKGLKLGSNRNLNPQRTYSKLERRALRPREPIVKPEPNLALAKENSGEEFPWSSYLEQTNSRAAWIQLFNNPFPAGPNPFRVGYKLEAIDPEHQSYICAATVVEIKGYRLKLHFDGYSKAHDFWVNADSNDIFPCGFCSKQGLPLQPPWGYNADTFSWQSYTSSWKARSAPSICFQNYRNPCPNLFRIGMKLEAVDRKNSSLVCVATVNAVLGSRILVHFDSWGEVYDYWADVSSPYIHPVGWCSNTHHHLTPPNGMKSSEFHWESYLKETESVAAPKRAFRLRPHIAWKRGTKVEAVDRRAPHLLRVATIRNVLPYLLLLTFDGFPDHFGYWIDDDSPDIHPVGWAARTGHLLQPPPTVEDFERSPCDTGGCLGEGHIGGGKQEMHSLPEECPYSLDNLHRDDLLPDRLIEKPSLLPLHRGEEIIDLDKSDDEMDIEVEEDVKERRWRWLGVREAARKEVLSLRVNGAVAQEGGNPLKWSEAQVTSFAARTLNKPPSEMFVQEEIDGEAFLMMEQEELTEVLGFKLGDAVKLYNAILLLREKVT